jgi:uncharacterized sulfatase
VKRLFSALISAAILFSAAARAEFDYQLKAQQVADGVFVVEGATEHFAYENGGNIVNSGFIVSDAGVLVIDTGPSRIYGEQFRALIERTTDKPIARVVNTHHHPDHFFGNQAFADLPIAALPQTLAAMRAEAGAFADNLYRLVGPAMIGTEVVEPQETLAAGKFQLGEREIELIALAGHSVADLALLDRKSGVLFASDLVFHQRAPTTPHATPTDWLASLDALAKLDFKQLVPGHGPVTDAAAIAETRDYLQWLTAEIEAAAARGDDMAEVMYAPLPERFAKLGAMPGEFRRSVAHLFPAREAAHLPLVAKPQ